MDLYDHTPWTEMDMEMIEDEPNVMCGPTPDRYGPGTDNFGSLVKSVATSATRIGESANYGLFFWRGIPEDVALAANKLREAQSLILGAHALLKEAHNRAVLTTK